MQFVRFGHHDTNGRFYERLGTDSFCQVDRRLSAANAHQRLIDLGKRKGFTGFQYYIGDSILNARPIGYPAQWSFD